MFGNHDDSYQRDAYNQMQNQPHEAKKSHELVAAGAAFAAMRMYENKQKEEGNNPSFALGKEAIAAFAAAEVDKYAETSGMDFYDKEKAKHQAAEQAKEALANSGYHGQEQYQQQQYQGGNYQGPQGYGPPQGQGWGQQEHYNGGGGQRGFDGGNQGYNGGGYGGGNEGGYGGGPGFGGGPGGPGGFRGGPGGPGGFDGGPGGPGGFGGGPGGPGGYGGPPGGFGGGGPEGFRGEGHHGHHEGGGERRW